ncbi:hypothetical protein SPC35_0016 [Salmonella phage Spc35]|uniref:Uncharacterized protein n=1 Tax=Salmonella phage Spc35 TaxID=2991866 RepID=E9N3W6_9CAUD|nr:hypothetical protein SPC35_0016 [Salmonella phage Spc35]ADW79996.1 hypothetical protein SPC35_0016 [Salmonella phage Spc35]
MSIKKNLAEIIKLARACNGKCVSQLNELEAHAVAFCAEFYPAYINASGQPKYNKDAGEVTLAPSYISLRRLIQTVDPTIKGFSADSFHVFADKELPHFKEGNAKSCLECYPNILMIPQKQCKYDHLPRLTKKVEPPYSSLSELKLGIVSTLAQVHLSIVDDSTTSNPTLDAAHFEILRDPEQARKVAKSVKFDISTILDTKQETRPRGSVDYSALNSESSYLATFLFMASKGVILKVNHDV